MIVITQSTRQLLWKLGELQNGFKKIIKHYAHFIHTGTLK